MKWSKLKKTYEERLHEDIKGRIEFQFARYSKSHDGWACLLKVLFDKKVIIEASYDYKQIMYNNLYGGDELEYQEHNIFDSMNFCNAMETILNTSIEDAINHESSYVRALALLDKRMGKRRFKDFKYDKDPYPIVKEFYRLRAGEPLQHLKPKSLKSIREKKMA